MYIAFLSILVAFALGFGIWAKSPAFNSGDYAEARSQSVARIILTQHNRAVAYVEEENSSGVRIRPTFTGAIDPPNTVGGISYNLDTFGDIPSVRIPGASKTDWATITYITPTMQQTLRDDSNYPMEPDSVLRNILDESGASRYAIGVFNAATQEIEPLDRSGSLRADPNSPLSPMDTNAGSPAWKTDGALPQLPNVPSGLVDGSWVLLTMTPSI